MRRCFLALVLAVLLAGCTAGHRNDAPAAREATTTTEATAPAVPLDRWRDIPVGPAGKRAGAVIGATSTELVVAGGRPCVGPTEDCASVQTGAAFDVARGRWRSIAPLPLRAGEVSTTVWTGRELVVLDGLGEGAAWDPGADRWRRIASPPGSPHNQPELLWTGSEVLLVGGAAMGSTVATSVTIATWNPTTDTWRKLPSPPGVGCPERTRTTRSVLTQTHLVVWSRATLFDPCGPTTTRNVYEGVFRENDDREVELAAALDLKTDVWAELPPTAGPTVAAWDGKRILRWGGDIAGWQPGSHLAADGTAPAPLVGSPLDGSGATAVWNGSSLIAVDSSEKGVHSVAAYDPGTDRWSALPPIGVGQDRHGVVVGSAVVAFDASSGSGATLTPSAPPLGAPLPPEPPLEHGELRLSDGTRLLHVTATLVSRATATRAEERLRARPDFQQVSIDTVGLLLPGAPPGTEPRIAHLVQFFGQPGTQRQVVLDRITDEVLAQATGPMRQGN